MVSDIRLLSSDLTAIYMHPGQSPSRVTAHESRRTRHASLTIPPCQAGSSIMPGKVNPVIPEFVISAAHRIYANDQLISSLCAQGCLELNAYLPAIGHALLESLKLLIACNLTIQKNLLTGLQVSSETDRSQVYLSPSITTALLPLLGYHQSAELAGYMKKNGVDIFEANRKLAFIPEVKLEKLMLPENLLKLGYVMGDMG
jgi:aspartate ammonia-lyase